MGKSFEKQTKTIKDQGEKQTETIKEQVENQIKRAESNKNADNKLRKIFDELSYERMTEMKDLSIQNDVDNLTYYFKDRSISLINFILVLRVHFRDIFNGNIELEKAEKDHKQFKLDLNEITKGNPKNKSEDQIKTVKHIKKLYESRKKVIKLYNDYAKIRSEAKRKSKHCTRLKIITFKQMFQRSPIALAHVEIGNNSENLLNEIRKIVYSLYQSKESPKKYIKT